VPVRENVGFDFNAVANDTLDWYGAAFDGGKDAVDDNAAITRPGMPRTFLSSVVAHTSIVRTLGHDVDP
jgi:hypothetical protein